MPKDPNEIGALWRKESQNGTLYFSGIVNGVSVVVFENKKKTADKQPDYRVFVSKPRESAAA